MRPEPRSFRAGASSALVVLLVAVACKREEQQPPPPAPPPAAAATPGGGGGTGTGAGRGGGAGQRFMAPVVYVDGVPVSFVQFAELPPGLQTTWLKLGDEQVRRFVLRDYIAALGVDVKKVRAVHLYSGRERVAIISGDQLRKETEPTMFQFTQDSRGKVQMRWPPRSPVNDLIDKTVNIAVYVDKKPPAFVSGKEGLWLDDVPVGDEIPYATADVQGGARIYLDGRLVTLLRPRDLDRDKPDHALLEAIAARGVSLEGVQAADLIWDEQLLRRVPAGDLAGLRFTMPSGAGGVLALAPGGEKVAAVLLYKQAAPLDWSKR